MMAGAGPLRRGRLPVMLFVGWLRGVKFFERDGSLGPGLLAGTLFGIEFVLIFTGPGVYLRFARGGYFSTPRRFFVALGSYQFLGERLTALQMERPRSQFYWRRTCDRRAAAECRRHGIAWRPPCRRRRRVVGGRPR